MIKSHSKVRLFLLPAHTIEAVGDLNTASLLGFVTHSISGSDKAVPQLDSGQSVLNMVHVRMFFFLRGGYLVRKLSKEDATLFILVPLHVEQDIEERFTVRVAVALCDGFLNLAVIITQLGAEDFEEGELSHFHIFVDDVTELKFLSVLRVEYISQGADAGVKSASLFLLILLSFLLGDNRRDVRRLIFSVLISKVCFRQQFITHRRKV